MPSLVGSEMCIRDRSPDGRGSAATLAIGAGEGDALVIETDPHAGGVVRRVADEPRVGVVLRRAGLSGGGEVKAKTTNARGSAGVHNIRERARHHVADARLKYILE